MVEAHISSLPKEILALLREECKLIQAEDAAMCKAISEYGLSLLKDGDGILTHCNAGPLATSKYGTALGPLFLGKERGVNFHVFSDETRPLLQGARLTSYELDQGGIDVTLICDNMASIVMKSGKVQACLVGCDRIAANGDAANKIGTSGVAILAKYYGIPFYVLGPSSTIDFSCKTGEDIVIEERNPEEIKCKFYEKPMALPSVKCYNPAFDVTQSDYRNYYGKRNFTGAFYGISEGGFPGKSGGLTGNGSIVRNSEIAQEGRDFPAILNIKTCTKNVRNLFYKERNAL